jgi:hypothetical protein
LDIYKIDHSYQEKVGSSTSKTKENGFKKVFDQKMNEISGTLPQNLLEGKTNVLNQGDKILNLLDDYGRVLTDPAKTLKEIEPLVERIEEEVSLFEVEAEQVGRDDEALTQITRDLATTAQVALLKFRRGDFL